MGRHWKVLGLATVVFVALASSVYAYWRINASATPYVTAISQPLELRMELDKTEFQRNETIIVHLFLKNIGSETITIAFVYANDDVGFIVKDENDTEVYVHPITFLTGSRHVVLEPGGHISGEWWNPTEWNQKGNHPGKYDSVLVPPGTYKIVGRTGKFTIEGKTPPPNLRIETPPMTITIS